MRSWMRTCVVICVLAVLGLSAAASSAAPGGVTPDIPTGGSVPKPTAPRANLDYQGGPVMHANRTHIIFWNPSNCSFNSHACSYDAGYQALAAGFLANVAADSHKASNVFALTGQYFDGSGHAFYDSTYAGAVNDTDAAPANGCTLPAAAPAGWQTCLSDAQIETELSSFISSHGLPNGPNDLYFLVTPEGFGSCFGTGPLNCSLGGGANAGFCGYHNFYGSTTAAPGLYANIPFNAEAGHCQSNNPRPNGSSVDPTLSTLSHEQAEAITDPFPAGAGNPQTGWVDSNPGSSTFGEEIGDLCAGSYGTALGSTAFGLYNESIGTGHYLLQEEWSNDEGGCAQSDEADTVSANVPTAAIAGLPVSLSGTGTDPDGAVNVYVWNFGDGAAGNGQSVQHTFTHAGTFNVTFLIQDVSGQRAAVTRVIRVTSASITGISTQGGKFKGKLSVSTNGPGTVQVGGTRETLHGAGTAHFTITLRGNAHKKIARKGKQKVTLTFKVTFVPVGGGAQTRTVSLTFHG